MKITHVIRGEDHLNNTIRQLMIYEALGEKTPEFAHVSLLVGHDRQKLSKRHGATSVAQYREQHFLPEAMNNYLCLLGWSHPEEKDIFKPADIADIFEMKRFSKSAALYDIEKLKWVNGQHLKELSIDQIVEQLEEVATPSVERLFKCQTADWKSEFISLFLEKVQTIEEYTPFLEDIFRETNDLQEDAQDVLSWETTPQIKELVISEMEKVSTDFISKDTLSEWMNTLKKEHKIKGKNLFMGLRVVLTGVCHGSDLTRLIPLTPKDVVATRVKSLV